MTNTKNDTGNILRNAKSMLFILPRICSMSSVVFPLLMVAETFVKYNYTLINVQWPFNYAIKPQNENLKS